MCRVRVIVACPSVPAATALGNGLVMVSVLLSECVVLAEEAKRVEEERVRKEKEEREYQELEHHVDHGRQGNILHLRRRTLLLLLLLSGDRHVRCPSSVWQRS